MERLRIPVDVIAGTSMGSIIGALYAIGMSPDEMEKTIREVDWNDALVDDPPRRNLGYRRKQDDAIYTVKAELGLDGLRPVIPRGFITGEKLGFMLRSMLIPAEGISDFDRLRIPYRAVATNLETGAQVILARGDLARAVRASMAIPGVFTPSEIDGMILVDGGMTANMPADVVRAMGADVVIAVNISTPLGDREKLRTVLSVLDQTSSFLTYLNVERQIEALADRDVLVQPDLTGVGTLEFARVGTALERGVAGAEAVKDRLAEFSVPEEEFARYLEGQRLGKQIPPIVDELRVAAVPGVDARWIEKRLTVAPGKPLDLARLRDDVSRIYELGDFDVVDFHVRTEGGRTILEIVPHEKPRAHGRLRFGIAVGTTFDTNTLFDLNLGYTLTHVNALRGEWRTRISAGSTISVDTELYQPVVKGGGLFVAPHAGFLRKKYTYFGNDQALFDLRADMPWAGLDLGLPLGRDGELGEVRVGYFRARGVGATTTSLISAKDVFNNGAAQFRLALDQLDYFGFPRQGYIANVEVDVARTALGSDANYDRFAFSGTSALTRGRTTFVGMLSTAFPLGGELPLWNWSSLGGPLRLSAMRPGQVFGQYMGFAGVLAYRQIGGASFLGAGSYAGISLETGNAWNSTAEVRLNDLRWSASAYFGVDTLLGPTYLGAAIGDRGNLSVYLLIGPLSR
jgi:NTE family protein